MQNPFNKEEKNAPIDEQIDAVLNDMKTNGVNSEEYPKLMSYLERLNKLKQQTKLPPVSRDTMVMVAGNLLGILLIVAYEQKHVLTSKGLNQLPRVGKT